MTIFSAIEDLSARTLAAISGTWHRLRYVARLRQPDGSYRHWGLERTYGTERAQTAIRNAHEGFFLELLRSPLRHLVREVDDSITEDAARASDLMPADRRGGSARHFASVLHALRALRRQRRDSGNRHEH